MKRRISAVCLTLALGVFAAAQTQTGQTPDTTRKQQAEAVASTPDRSLDRTQGKCSGAPGAKCTKRKQRKPWFFGK